MTFATKTSFDIISIKTRSNFSALLGLKISDHGLQVCHRTFSKRTKKIFVRWTSARHSDGCPAIRLQPKFLSSRESYFRRALAKKFHARRLSCCTCTTRFSLQSNLPSVFRSFPRLNIFHHLILSPL